MLVYITRDVKQALNAYRKALRKYPISRDRMHEKYNNMVNVLLSLGNDQGGLRPCIHKKLGQRFSSTNEPILKICTGLIFQMTRNFNGHLVLSSIN